MPRQTIVGKVAARIACQPRGGIAIAILTFAGVHVAAQQPSTPGSDARATPRSANTADRQAELDAGLVEMLSGATLDGSFTSTGKGRDSRKLSSEKYTLGNVKKLAGNFWLIPARIEYGEHDVTLPITVPIEWAGDTPMVVVDNIPLPGFGTVSARVMFFADHYAGYWKHGDHGGHLFGVIQREEQPGTPGSAPTSNDHSVDQTPADEKPKDQPGQR
jgi:hypothetical protein